MARPRNKPRDPISEALIQLRQALGENQQQFANRTQIAMTTIARYETSRRPTGKALAQFARVAEQAGRHDLATVFETALTRELGTDSPVLSQTEQALTAALVDSYRAAPRDVIAAVEMLGKGAKGDPVRWNQLESLLVLLRKDSGPVNRRFEARVVEIAARDGVSRGQATATAMLEDPKLYSDWQREAAQAARGTVFEKTVARPAQPPKKRSSK